MSLLPPWLICKKAVNILSTSCHSSEGYHLGDCTLHSLTWESQPLSFLQHWDNAGRWRRGGGQYRSNRPDKICFYKSSNYTWIKLQISVGREVAAATGTERGSITTRCQSVKYRERHSNICHGALLLNFQIPPQNETDHWDGNSHKGSESSHMGRDADRLSETRARLLALTGPHARDQVRIRSNPRVSGPPENRDQNMSKRFTWHWSSRRHRSIRCSTDTGLFTEGEKTNSELAVFPLLSFVPFCNTTTQMDNLLFLALSEWTYSLLGLYHSGCSLVSSLPADTRPCWTAGTGSHWGDPPSLTWWKGWETCFRPVCSRYGQMLLLKYYALFHFHGQWSISIIGLCQKWQECRVYYHQLLSSGVKSNRRFMVETFSLT